MQIAPMHHLMRNAATVPTAALLVAVTLVLTAPFHVGIQPSDDAEYLTGALGWLQQFDREGNVLVNVFLDPLLNLFISPNLRCSVRLIE